MSSTQVHCKKKTLFGYFFALSIGNNRNNKEIYCVEVFTTAKDNTSTTGLDIGKINNTRKY